MERIQFETEVKDIKTSKVKDDTCPMEGELFGDVGQTVTFAIVDNAQQSLGE